MLEETKKILDDISNTTDEITSKEQTIYELQIEINSERLKLGDSLAALKESPWLVGLLGEGWDIEDEDLLEYLEDIRGKFWGLEG